MNVSRLFLPISWARFARRVMRLAPHDELFGSLRIYAIPHDDPRVEVVRSLDMAFAKLGVAPAEFEPLRA